jgi:hypothetical protein
VGVVAGYGELGAEEAVALAAASVRSLFAFVSEQQARDVATAVFRGLRGRGARLVRDEATEVRDGQPAG